MIITIAVYDAKRVENKTLIFWGEQKVYIALAYRLLDKNNPMSDYESGALVRFEKQYLQQLADNFLNLKATYNYNEHDAEHYYTFKSDDKISLIVFISKSKLNDVELYCLKYHLASALYSKPGLDEEENNLRIKALFEKIIKDSLHYTKRESIREKNQTKMMEIKHDLDDLTKKLKQDIEKILNRGDMLEHLKVRAENLEDASKGFKSGAFEANRACCKLG